MKKLLLSLLTGIFLLFISWPNNGLSFYLFAFVPLFILSDIILKKVLSSFSAIKFFFFFLFFLFNVLTSYWIWNASPGFDFFAFIVNSLMMTFVFWTFHSRKVISTRLSFFLLITV